MLRTSENFFQIVRVDSRLFNPPQMVFLNSIIFYYHTLNTILIYILNMMVVSIQLSYMGTSYNGNDVH